MPTLNPERRRILYVGDTAPAQTSALRFHALKRLGQEVKPFESRPYQPHSRIGSWLQFRYPVGPLVTKINQDLRKAAAEFRPDLVWFDKPTLFSRETFHALRQAGAKIVFYVQDAPFGPRNDGCWRQFMRIYRMADLHCLFRKADVARYSAWGLPWIETMFSFDPLMHFPPDPSFSDAQRTREISYIGHPHEERPRFLLSLARDYRLPVFVNGNRWERVLTPEEQRHLTLGNFMAEEVYRSGIWRSKINLSFVTKANEDDIAHKAVEIAACGSFLMAVRTPGHQALFEEDKEAVFFDSVEECADKAKFYLNRPDLRQTIAAHARERAVRGGYDNDTQLARILKRLDEDAT